MRRVQGAGAWRALGRRMVVPRLEIVEALEDPGERWRDVYEDFAARDDGGRSALRGAWIAVRRRRGLGGVLLHPFDPDRPEGGGSSTCASGAEPALFLSAMRVRGWCRGWGIGGLLVRYAQGMAGRRGAGIWLVVEQGNDPAVRLYLSHGFAVVDPPASVARPGHMGMRWLPETRESGTTGPDGERSGS